MANILACKPDTVGKSPTDILDNLIDYPVNATERTLRVVWDLDRLVSDITSLLPETARQSLSLPKHKAYWEDYKLYYIPGKLFSVNRNHKEATYYDLSQYFPEDTEPDTLARLQKKADQLSDTIRDLGIPSPTTLASPVAVARGSNLLNGCQDTIPTIFDAPASILDAYEIALQCTPHEWVCNYQVGYWGQNRLWNYDLVSAYPFQASRLLDLRDCSFRRGTELDYSAYYGFLVGDFTVYPEHPLAFCSPFLADRGDGVLVNFTGTQHDYPCLLDEVRMLYRTGLGEFKLKEGWYANPLGGVSPRLPFQSLMDNLYPARSQSPLTSSFIKRVMNGIIGKLLETRKDKDGNITEYGELYNSIYHALITTRTRLQVFDFIVDNDIIPEELVFIGVDGVKVARRLPIPDKADMGQWRCTGSQSTFILSPGAVITPKRNFKKTGYVKFLLDLLEHPTASKYGVDKDIDLRGLFRSQTRDFGSLPQNGKELLDNRYLSTPVEL